MPQLVCELIVSLDGKAKGRQSPAYFGYDGPDFMRWVETNSAVPHRMILGRRTYEMLNGVPEDARDAGWNRTAETPGWLFTRKLKTADWPGLQVVHEDAVEFVREEKGKAGTELRTLGSISIVKQLLKAGLIDRLKLVVCPLVLPETGAEPLFTDLPDLGFELASFNVLDERVLLLEYQPAGAPPQA
jgi:dihydrofolate reductase